MRRCMVCSILLSVVLGSTPYANSLEITVEPGTAYPTIQSCINETPPAGESLFCSIKNGVYREALTINKDVYIDGDGWSGHVPAKVTLKPPWGHVKGEPLISITGGVDVQISGMSIDGAGIASGIRAIDGPSSSYPPLLFGQCLSIKGCRSFDSTYAPAIHAVGYSVHYNFGWIKNNTGGCPSWGCWEDL